MKEEPPERCRERGAVARLSRLLTGTTLATGDACGAGVFLHNAQGQYLGRICKWKQCAPGNRTGKGGISDDFKPFAGYRAVAKKIAGDLSLTFVPFQAAFDEAVKAAPAEFWLTDGIHPSPAGHALMVETWRKAACV